MKKTLPIVLFSVMLFVLAACASKDVPAALNQTEPATEVKSPEPTDSTDSSVSDTETESETKKMKIQITIGDKTMTATLSDNASAKAFYDLLKNGPVTVDTRDYGGFEKVGPLGTTIVRSDENITTSPGDIILYLGDQVTIYYDVNTWNFTLLGHVDGATGENMRAFLGDGDPTVTFEIKD